MNPGHQPPPVLVALGDARVATALAGEMKRSGLKVSAASRSGPAGGSAADQRPLLLLVDEAGVPVCARYPGVPVICLTSDPAGGAHKAAGAAQSTPDEVWYRSLAPRAVLPVTLGAEALTAVVRGILNTLTGESAATKADPDTHYLQDELYQLVRSDPAIFDFLQSGSLDGIWYWDLENQEHEWMSPRFWELFGYRPEDKQHLAGEWQDMIFPDDLATAVDNLQKHLADPAHPYDQIVRYRHRDGHTVWVRCRGLAVRRDDGTPVRMLGAHNDLTAVMSLLEERKLLMQELNHRVKNNMAIVGSLVSLKQRELGDGADLSDLEHQIEALRLLHERLQQDANVTSVDLRTYLEGIVHGVLGDAAHRLSLVVRGPVVEVSSRSAVPLGLITNELATNALKYSFADGGPGSFQVEIQPPPNADEQADAAWTIVVESSGPPFPESVNLKAPQSLGMSIIQSLVAELDGSLHLRREPSPCFSIRVPLEGCTVAPVATSAEVRPDRGGELADA